MYGKVSEELQVLVLILSKLVVSYKRKRGRYGNQSREHKFLVFGNCMGVIPVLVRAYRYDTILEQSIKHYLYHSQISPRLECDFMTTLTPPSPPLLKLTYQHLPPPPPPPPHRSPESFHPSHPASRSLAPHPPSRTKQDKTKQNKTNPTTTYGTVLPPTDRMYS